MQPSVRPDGQPPEPIVGLSNPLTSQLAEPQTAPMQFGSIAISPEVQVMSPRAHRAGAPAAQHMGDQGDISMEHADAAGGSTVDQSLWAIMPTQHQQ